MVHMGETNQWKLGPRKYHADDHVVGQTYAELFMRYHDEKMITPMRATFAAILAEPIELPIDHERKTAKTNGHGATPCSWARPRGCACPLPLAICAIAISLSPTGGKLPITFTIPSNISTSATTVTSPNAKPTAQDFLESRQRLVMAGLVRMLQHLPADHPDRARFIQQFQQMAEKIRTLQQPDGLWRSSLLDAKTYPLKETSGSSFLYLRARLGHQPGLVTAQKFEPTVERAWQALVDCVNPDGKLTHVQPISADPRKFKEDSTDCFGVGAFLLAGSEVYRLKD